MRQRRKYDLNFNKYDIDSPDHVIILNDWYDQPTMTKFTMFTHQAKSKNNINAFLINGKGSARMFSRNNGTEMSRTPKSVFKVQSGKKYRFRIISAAFTACAIQISFENHSFSVIATDGHPVVPSSDLEALVLYPGSKIFI